MAFKSKFVTLSLESLHREAAVMKAEGWRFVQTHAVNTESGIDLYYSFMKDGYVVNYCIDSVSPDVPVPSITDLFLSAFVFENEARELFGINMQDIAIDFKGAMYAPAEKAPMTFMSPEQKAMRDKVRAASQTEKDKTDGKDEKAAPTADSSQNEVVIKSNGNVQADMTTFREDAGLEALLASMDPEKAERVRAALGMKGGE